MRPVLSPEVMRAEIDSIVSIVEKWRAKVEQGVPGVEIPADDEIVDTFLLELAAEFLLVSGKCETFANIVSSR